jgi:hypothetical protein
MVYGETFLRNFKFYAKTLTKLHDLTVLNSTKLNVTGPILGTYFKGRFQELALKSYSNFWIPTTLVVGTGPDSKNRIQA